MKQFLNALLFVFLLGVVACTEKKSTEALSSDTSATEHANDTLEQSTSTTVSQGGLVQSRLACASNSSNTYALYLPSMYSRQQAFPLLLIFDPQGKGEVSVTKYKTLADKFGYILVGSNNSRNGMAWNEIEKISNQLLDEVLKKYSINSKRIYTMGFSGGARVAANVAIANPRITGVIGCSAGFLNSSTSMGYNFDFFGMAGEADFNRAEMKTLDHLLDPTGMVHYILIYEGGHEWADEKTMNYAFLWNEFRAMRKSLVAKNDSLVQQFTQQEINIAEAAKKIGDMDAALYAQSRIVQFTEGLQDVSTYKKQVAELVASPAMRKQLDKDMLIQQEEETQSRNYWSAMQEQNLAWWKAEIKKLQAGSKSGNKVQKFKNKRLLGFLGLAVYMHAIKAVSRKDAVNGEKFLAIYALVAPENPEKDYLRACFAAQLSDKKSVLSNLKKAIELGFNDKTRMLTDTSFVAFRQDGAFLQISSSIK